MSFRPRFCCAQASAPYFFQVPASLQLVGPPPPSILTQLTPVLPPVAGPLPPLPPLPVPDDGGQSSRTTTPLASTQRLQTVPSAFDTASQVRLVPAPPAPVTVPPPFPAPSWAARASSRAAFHSSQPEVMATDNKVNPSRGRMKDGMEASLRKAPSLPRPAH